MQVGALLAVAHAHGLKKAAAHGDAAAHVPDHGGVVDFEQHLVGSVFLALDEARAIGGGAAQFQHDLHAVFPRRIPGKGLHFGPDIPGGRAAGGRFLDPRSGQPLLQ